MVKGGIVDSALSCGIEMMSKIPLGATIIKELDRRAIDSEEVLHHAVQG